MGIGIGNYVVFVDGAMEFEDGHREIAF